MRSLSECDYIKVFFKGGIMERFVEYEKLSKKKQKEINNAKRGTWGNIKPVTKVKPSAKVYDRKRMKTLVS